MILHRAFAVALAALTLPVASMIQEGAPAAPDAPAAYPPSGFDVSGTMLHLRARALDEYARPALEELATTALDRATTELLMALARGRDRERAFAAGRALVGIAERGEKAGHLPFAGEIGEALYLSSQPEDVRARAYPLFMLLDNERARRHRR